ncbi:MAG: cupredoxin domain-containing protein [Ilumatobacteraceae bacterium]
MGKIPALVAIVVAVVLSVLGVGVVANAADQVGISITDTLSPASVTIHAGATVTWTNNDSQQHELRSTGGPTQFRTSTLDAGQTASVTFSTVGTYTYVDHRNDQVAAYHGTIVVTNDAAPVTAPPATTPGPAPAPTAPATASIHLAGARFAPASATVAVGGTVTWTNDDGSKHTVTADNAAFDSGTLNAGATFAHTFTAAGTYAYGCDFHGNMRGTIIVLAAGTTTPPPAPPTTVAPAPPTITPPAGPPAAPAPPAAPGAAVTNVSVTIANNLFSPAAVTIDAGSTVTWVNNDTVTHTATADDQSFASGLVKKNTSWSHTFATPGTFTYFCEIHPEMTGTVIANAPDGTVPAGAPAAAPSAATTAAATAAATSSTAGSTASAGAAAGTVTISDAGFAPASFRVAVGGTVTFANNGKAMHTVTAGGGSFDSDMIRSGGTWAHTFTTPGSFAYNCILHPTMRGTIVVGAGGGSSATQAASASQAAGGTAQTDSTATAAATSAADTAIQPVNIDVADNEFTPNDATVAQSGTVTWKLVGDAAHTVTADDQSFNSGLLKPGESYQYTFTTLGSFSYACLVHPGMTATIKVVPPAEAATAQQAAPTSGGASQRQPAAGQPTATATTAPAPASTLWGDTLLGIAAVLLACCALVFALRSFLKVLCGGGEDTETATTSTDGLTPHAI